MAEEKIKKIKRPKENIEPLMESDINIPSIIDGDSPFQVDFNAKKIVIIPTQVSQRLDFDMNDAASAAGGAFVNRVITFTTTDVTPSVKNANVCITAGTTSITDFDDGVVGQVIMIKATAGITITDGAPIILSGGANYDMTDTDTLTLCMFDDQVWNETSRSVN